MARYMIADFSEISPVPCPCGQARRAFASPENSTATLHRVEIDGAAELHHHREHTEIYYVLACDPGAEIELDGERHPLRPGMAVLIPPGVRHRAIGRLEILNLVTPPFDPRDEHLD